MTTLTLSPDSGYTPPDQYEKFPTRPEDKVSTVGDKMTGTLEIDKSTSSSIIDYTIHLKGSGGTSNAGRALFSQGSMYGLALAVNSSGSTSAYASFQWIDVATGAVQSTPIRLDYDGSIRIPANARIMGDFSSAAASRTIIQSSVTNGVTGVQIAPNGTATDAAIRVFNSSDVNNCSFGDIAVSTTSTMVRSGTQGSGTSLPMWLMTGGQTRLHIAANGTITTGGATPSAWASPTGALQVGTYTNVFTDINGGATFAHNCYESSAGVFTYATTFNAALYRQQSGTHTWFTAASGTAGTPVSFVQALTISSAGNSSFGGHALPISTNTYDLGSTTLRWRNIYTQDLHLSNGIGDYTVIEGEENLYLVNNKSGKSFKFALIEVDPSEVPPKSNT